METLKSVLAGIGLVVVVAGTVLGTIKVLAKYGTQIVAGCKAANQHVSAAIRKMA